MLKQKISVLLFVTTIFFHQSLLMSDAHVASKLVEDVCLEAIDLQKLNDLITPLMIDEGADIIDHDELGVDDHHSRLHSLLLLLLKRLLYSLEQGAMRNAGSRKLVYELSRGIAAIGLGPNFANTNVVQTTRVGPQFSRTSGGVQRILIGVAESGSTQPSALKIGNNLIGTTGANTINIGTGPQPTALTIGNANPLSTLTFPGDVNVTGSISFPAIPVPTNINLSGDLTVGGNETVVGTLTATNLTVMMPPISFTNLHLTGNLTVNGVSTFNGPLAGHGGAMVTGGAFSAPVGNNQISLTSTQAASDAILLTAMSTATRGLTATVGATNGFTVTGGPFEPQATFAITNGALMQSGGAVSLDAGASTIDFTSTNVSASAIQLAGKTQITGTFNPLLAVTANAGVTVAGGNLIVSAGGVSVNGNLMQSGGTLSLTSTGAATIDSTGSVTIGGMNTTDVTIARSAISTTITGGLTQSGGPLSLTSTGAGVIDVSGAPGTLTIGASAADITIGNRAAAGNAVTIEGGATAPGGIYIATANTAHQIDIGTGTPAAGVESVDIGNNNIPSNMISIGGNASTTTVKGNLTQLDGVLSLMGTGTSSINSATGTLGIGETSDIVNVGNTSAGTIVTFESGPTGAINIGNSTNAHTINVGTGAAVNTINIATGAPANIINIGGANSTTTFHGNLTQSGGNISLTSEGAGTVDATTTLMLGASTATAVSIGNNGATTRQVLIEAGSMAPGGINIGTSAASHLINIGTGSPGVGVQTISIGTGATPTNAIMFGGGTNSTTTVTGTLTKPTGSPFTLTSTGTATINGNAALNIGASTATATNIGSTSATTSISIEGVTINIANTNFDHMIFIADGAGAQTITIGSTSSSSSVMLAGGMAAAADNGVRYQIGGGSLLLAPVGYSLPTTSAPATVRISSGLLTDTTTITAAGTGDWTHSSGVITFQDPTTMTASPFASSSTAYVTVLDYGATNPIGNAVTPVFAPTTIAADGTTLTIGGYNAANFYAFLVMGR